MLIRRQPGHWLATGLAVAFLTAAGGGQGKNPSLAGTWKFSPEKTSAAADEAPDPTDVRKRTRSSPAGSSGTAAPQRDMGGGGGGGGQPSAGGFGGGMSLGPLNLYARPMQELVIEQTDSTVTISDPRGTPRIYHPDGRKEVEALLGGDSLEIVAKWKGGKLTTERKLGKFGSISEAYWLDGKTQSLILDVKLTAPQLSAPIQRHRVYDAATGGGGGDG